jgi:hypothetical protein
MKLLNMQCYHPVGTLSILRRTTAPDIQVFWDVTVFHQSTQRNIAEVLNVQQHRHETRRSRKEYFVL